MEPGGVSHPLAKLVNVESALAHIATLDYGGGAMSRRATRAGVATNGAAGPGRRARSQTIERAALVLTCFSAEEPQLGLAELAGRLDLNASTVYRYVATLEDAGLLVRNQRGGYRLMPQTYPQDRDLLEETGDQLHRPPRRLRPAGAG